MKLKNYYVMVCRNKETQPEWEIMTDEHIERDETMIMGRVLYLNNHPNEAGWEHGYMKFDITTRSFIKNVVVKENSMHSENW